jgi:hypothetical protein
MDQPFFKEDLECPIYGNPVEFFTRSSFDVTMRQSPFLLKEQFQYPSAATGDAQVISLQ